MTVKMVGSANLGDPILPYDCEHCQDARWFWMHDAAGDGHGGLNGGAWDYFPCGQCNNPIVFRRGGWGAHPGMFPCRDQIEGKGRWAR